MKNRIVSGGAVIAAGLLTALGPRFLFRVCPAAEGMIMKCHWSAQAEIGIGALIAALGAALVFFANPKTRLGLIVGVFLSGVLALLIPHALIGGCSMHTMPCRKTAFPAITVIAILLLMGSALYAFYLARKKE
ncbi:MAG: DUF4418 family protein [Treponema sp.]|jgi:hypothetical protein|nr:DUF4418 family protein [Treponema sp.]